MELIISIIVWGALGYWGSYIMKNKNRSEVAGFAWGALLGLIGILVCALHSTKTPENTDILDKT